MTWINKKLILECLKELSDRDMQCRLWLSKGGFEVSSFTEAVEQLFTDSGLESELRNRTTEFGAAAEDALLKLENQLNRVDRRVPPDVLIDDDRMKKVRELAAATLSLIEATQNTKPET